MTELRRIEIYYPQCVRIFRTYLELAGLLTTRTSAGKRECHVT